MPMGNLRVNQASLWGQSVRSRRNAEIVRNDTELRDVFGL